MKNLYNKCLVILALIAFSSTFAQRIQAQDMKSYSAKLEELLDVSGSREVYATVVVEMMDMIRDQYSEIDTEIWDGLEKEFLSLGMNDLVEMLTPVYSKYLSEKDLDGLIDFYKTPVGQKYAKSTPMISTESLKVGQEWGEKIGRKFLEKLMDESAE